MTVAFTIITRALQAFFAGLLVSCWIEANWVAAQDGGEPDIKIQKENEEMERRAKRVADMFRQKGMVDLIDQMGTRVRGALGVIDSENKKEKESLVQPPNSSLRAILFASSSIPLPTLRAYAVQLEKVNGVIVFRGVPGSISAIKPIVELTHKIILRNPDCKGQDCDVYDVGVILDPLIFRNNSIDRVPALMIVDHDPFAAYCERPSEEAAGSISGHVTYGDAHLSGHFDALGTLGDSRAPLLLRALGAEKGGAS